ncbi:hypothetical protein L9F63_019005, partial [Diploptera punctata]
LSRPQLEGVKAITFLDNRLEISALHYGRLQQQIMDLLHLFSVKLNICRISRRKGVDIERRIYRYYSS